MENIPIDGKTSLNDQENSLRFIELGGPYELVTFKKKGEENAENKINMASFKELGLGDPILKLYLVEVPAGGDAVSLIRDNLAKGRKIIFQEELYVSSAVKMVLGFRDLK